MLGNYQQISQASGISVHLPKQGDADIAACVISLKNDKLDFEQKVTGLISLSQLSEKINTKLPVALNISGRGVLYKQLEEPASVGQHNFAQVLPNADISGFYVQQFVSGNKNFVAVIRRDLADKWIADLDSNGYSVVMLSLGPFPVSHILKQLNFYDAAVEFDGYRISRDEEENWTDLQTGDAFKATFPLKIDVEAVDQKLLLPYAAAFQLVLSAKLNMVHAEVPSVEVRLAKLLATKKVQVYAGVSLVLFFIILLVNFIVLMKLTAANDRLAGQVTQSSQHDIDRQGQEIRIKRKEGLLKQLGWDGGIRKSRLIDEVAALLPSEITWQDVTINPVDNLREKSRTELLFQERTIRVSGSSVQIIPVNEWIARVKTKKWVKNVQLENYSYNNELNTGQFSVTITY